MLQNPCKTLGFKKKMVNKIPPGGGGKPYPASGLVNPEVFARNLFSRITLRPYLLRLNLRLGHDLPISLIERVISSFRRDCFSRNFAVSRK